MKTKSAWLWGALFTLIVTAIPHGLLLLLIQFRVEFGKDIFSMILLFATAALEFPALVIGRLLRLQLENSSTGFILPDFNLWGYVLTFLFWMIVGACSGWILDKRNVPAKKTYQGLLWFALIVLILLLWVVKIFVFDF